MAGIRVCHVDDIAPGEKRTVEVAGRSLVLMRDGTSFHAVRGLCPHQGAPLGDGRLGGTMVDSPVGAYCYGRQGQVLRCPWHGWEFDITTGRSLHDPDGARVRRYEVTVEGSDVFVHMGPVQEAAG